jgi:hypothetical protein
MPAYHGQVLAAGRPEARQPGAQQPAAAGVQPAPGGRGLRHCTGAPHTTALMFSRQNLCLQWPRALDADKQGSFAAVALWQAHVAKLQHAFAWLSMIASMQRFNDSLPKGDLLLQLSIRRSSACRCLQSRLTHRSHGSSWRGCARSLACPSTLRCNMS